jgi:hypothetical protein
MNRSIRLLLLLLGVPALLLCAALVLANDQPSPAAAATTTAPDAEDSSEDEDEDDAVATSAMKPFVKPTTRPALVGSHAAAQTYQFLQQRIIHRQANMEDLPGFALVIRHPMELERVRQALEAAAREPTPERYRELYALFSRAGPNADVLYQFLDAALALELERAAANPDRAAQLYAWPIAMGLSAVMDGYEATGEFRFLELFMRTYDRMLDARDSEHRRRDEVRERVMKTWGYHHRERWTSVVTHAGRIGYPVGRFCLAIREDKQLRRQHNEKAQEYMNSIKVALREFDEDFRVIEGTNEGYYVRRSIGDVEPLNHMHAVGNALVLLHVLTGKDEYRAKVEQLANYFRGCIEQHANGSWTWGLQPTPAQRKGHDPELIWKAEVTMNFPLTAMEHGLAFTREELRPLVNTFMKNIWRGGEDASINVRIGPEMAGELKRFRIIGWNRHTSSFLGWICLDRLDRGVREVVEQAMIQRTDLYDEGWLEDFKTVEVYAHRLKAAAEIDKEQQKRAAGD